MDQLVNAQTDGRVLVVEGLTVAGMTDLLRSAIGKASAQVLARLATRLPPH